MAENLIEFRADGGLQEEDIYELSHGLDYEDWHERIVTQSAEDYHKAGHAPDPYGCYATEDNSNPCRWRPSIYLPKGASRTWLRITDIRAERVQDISTEDAFAEGVHSDMDIVWQSGDDTQIGLFGELWDGTNAKRGYSWETGPWVWVIEFEKIDP